MSPNANGLEQFAAYAAAHKPCWSSPRRGFAFEYVEGTLCVSQRGRLILAADIDGLRDATVELVARIRGEVKERLGEAQGLSGISGWES